MILELINANTCFFYYLFFTVASTGLKVYKKNLSVVSRHFFGVVARGNY